MSTIIEPCTVEQFFQSPNRDALLAAYAQESSLPEIGDCNAAISLYRDIEAAGALYPLAAYRDGEMVGFLSILHSVLPHYGTPVCITESFFVLPEARAGGAGLKLLQAAEAKARELGAPALLVSAPAGGRLAQIAPRLGYRQSNVVFVKGLGHANQRDE